MKPTRRKYNKIGCDIFLENKHIGKAIRDGGWYIAIDHQNNTLGMYSRLIGAEKDIYRSYQKSIGQLLNNP